jgi:hypothetical protein
MAPLDEFHKNVPLSPGGTLSLENVNGNVEIHGWEMDELEVFAEKTLQLPDQSKFYVFPRKDFAPGIVFDKFENFVKIRTKDVSEHKEIAFVDYYIDVPRSINLKGIILRRGTVYISEVHGDAFLDVEEGDITVESFSGSLTASTVRGSVSAVLLDLRDQDEIVITSESGDITVSLEGDAGAHLVAEFPEGEIISEFDIDVPSEEKKIDVQWGAGGPHISLMALKGNIKIKKINQD